MTIPPLAIVQARIGSTRLPRKMLLDLGGRPLVWWAWNASVQAFGAENVVVAIPAGAENDELAWAAIEMGALVCPWAGPENDVLGRFHYVAHRYRWHPDSVIVRVTPDDWAKQPSAMRRVAAGYREPVEIGGEAFTLAMLDEAHARERNTDYREHITHALFPWMDPPPPPPAPHPWSIDTQVDLDAARRYLADQEYDSMADRVLFSIGAQA